MGVVVVIEVAIAYDHANRLIRTAFGARLLQQLKGKVRSTANVVHQEARHLDIRATPRPVEHGLV